MLFLDGLCISLSVYDEAVENGVPANRLFCQVEEIVRAQLGLPNLVAVLTGLLAETDVQLYLAGVVILGKARILTNSVTAHSSPRFCSFAPIFGVGMPCFVSAASLQLFQRMFHPSAPKMSNYFEVRLLDGNRQGELSKSHDPSRIIAL